MEEAGLECGLSIVGINIHGVFIFVCCLIDVFLFTPHQLTYLSWVTELVTDTFWGNSLTGKARFSRLRKRCLKTKVQLPDK